MQKHFQPLRPVSGKRRGRKPTFIFKDLTTSESAWLRLDTQKGALKHPYQGHYKIIKRRDKTFDIQLSGENVMVSIDRLRPAYTLADINEPQTQKVHNPVKEQEQSNPPSLIEEPSEDRENSAPKKSIT